MTMEQVINMLVAYKGISQAELARRIDMSPQNFRMRIKRETFTREELDKIAKAVGAAYFAFFQFPEGLKINAAIEADNKGGVENSKA